MHAPRCTFRFLAIATGVLPALVAAPVDSSSPPRSPRTNAALLATLPKFDPQAAAAPATPATNAAGVAETIERDGLVILPDYQVQEKKVAEPHPDDWLKGDAVTRREMRRMEADMNTLELILNRWGIPILGPSFADRARAKYQSRRFRGEFTRVLDLAKIVSTFDPLAAQELRDALDFRKLPKEHGK